jgi:hypothetical protein
MFWSPLVCSNLNEDTEIRGRGQSLNILLSPPLPRMGDNGGA